MKKIFKHSKIIVIVLLLTALVGVGIVYAATLEQDGILSSNDVYTDSAVTPVLFVQSSAPCAATTTVGVFRFDVGTGDPVNGSSFSTSVLGNALAGNGMLSLVPVTNNDFGTLTNADVLIGSPILQKTFAEVPGPGNPLTFSGAALDTYINDNRDGSNRISFALAVTECAAGGPSLTIASGSNTAAAVPTLSTPTAVAVDSFSANNSFSPVMGVGLLLVVVLLLGGFVVLRRRDTVA